eukprot:TRINITY_DN856_c0_g2_i2.p1 TRINITY_DN856_c0_g2~~TRINITY_DN856_c0_g2_i2.p1  ORF type:complete len:321 (-),score=140.00 TRINITY_DN856_c0_g2_i2:260-1159(-)
MAKKQESPFKANILSSKIALVTGGGSGIGFEITRQLGLHGAKIAIMGRRPEPLAAAVSALKSEGIDAIGVNGDVRKPQDCERVVGEVISKFGGLNILVNNAAGNFLATAEGLKPKGFQTVMEIDTMGVFNMSNAAFSSLKKAGDSLIINISATLHYGATWYQAHASAAKAAIDSLTRSLALEWGEYGIRVAGIAPGPIAGTAGMAKLGGDMSHDAMVSAIPLRRFGEKFDIAMCAVYLASSAGAFVTGETIVVDGAAWIWRQPVAPRQMVEQLSRKVEKTSRETGIPTKKADGKIKSKL